MTLPSSSSPPDAQGPKELQSVLTQLPSVEILIAIAVRAGQEILNVGTLDDIGIVHKADDSPVTNADYASHRLIERELGLLNLGWPIVSEEGNIPPYEERKEWETFWLVDPLDGTKEFIDGTDRFGVNIALIHQGRPVFGLMHFPAKEQTFCATKGHGAFVYNKEGLKQPLKNHDPLVKGHTLRVLGTAAEPSERLDHLMEHWGKDFSPLEWVSLSGPFKFCWLALGQVEVYPRCGPSAEWDTAPPEVILGEIGCRIVSYPEFVPLSYNKPEFSNPWFVCGLPTLWETLKPTSV